MKMENLRSILLKLQDSLGELEAILVEEVNQLRRIQINPVSLQIVSDSKSQLLATITHYDDLRKQQEKSLHLSAPYQQNARFASYWNNITRKVKNSNELNIKIYELLELHMQKTDNLKKLVNNAGATSSLYSQEGQSNTPPSGKVYNISV
ncbi:flagellar export chaperone FlgN [Rahnella bruchi]|uniref:flagella synthesis protein FlgN n=1 Tax=Rahnella bruchi TaxID=1510573 RepID=UPI000EA103CF|nr:flagellar export chaperone FlgN [Rahnella bruchi]